MSSNKISKNLKKTIKKQTNNLLGKGEFKKVKNVAKGSYNLVNNAYEIGRSTSDFVNDSYNAAKGYRSSNSLSDIRTHAVHLANNAYDIGSKSYNLASDAYALTNKIYDLGSTAYNIGRKIGESYSVPPVDSNMGDHYFPHKSAERIMDQTHHRLHNHEAHHHYSSNSTED